MSANFVCSVLLALKWGWHRAHHHAKIALRGPRARAHCPKPFLRSAYKPQSMDSCVLGVVPVCINEKREPLDFRTRELVEIHMYIDQSRAVASAPASSTQTSLRSTIYRQVRPGRLSQFKLQPRHRDHHTQLGRTACLRQPWSAPYLCFPSR